MFFFKNFLSPYFLELMMFNFAELMLMGFISLFLTVTEEHIPHICIQKSLAFHFLPCKNNDSHDEIQTEEASKCEEQV